MSISSVLMRAFGMGRKSPINVARDGQRVARRRVEPDKAIDRRDTAKTRDHPQHADVTMLPVPAVAGELPKSDYPVFLVSYVDVHGVRSERHLQIRSAFRLRQKLFVKAWCGQKQRERPFRVDRIDTMVSAFGQEITSPFQFLSNMTVDANGETESHNRVMVKAMPGLTALLWIGGPEAEFNEADEDLMLEFIDRRIALGNSKRDHSWDRNVALAWIYDAKPGRGDCRASLRRLEQQSGEIALLQEIAGRMVFFGGTADTARTARRDELSNWLASEKKAARQNSRR